MNSDLNKDLLKRYSIETVHSISNDKNHYSDIYIYDQNGLLFYPIIIKDENKWLEFLLTKSDDIVKVCKNPTLMISKRFKESEQDQYLLKKWKAEFLFRYNKNLYTSIYKFGDENLLINFLSKHSWLVGYFSEEIV